MTVWLEELTIASLIGLKYDSPIHYKRLSQAVARVDSFRLEIGIGVARLPWIISASGMCESEEEIGIAPFSWIIFANGMSEEESMTTSLYPSSAPSCRSQLIARRFDLIEFPRSKQLSIEIGRSPESVQRAGKV